MIRKHLAIIGITLLLTGGCTAGPAAETARCAADSDVKAVVVFWDRSASAADTRSTSVFGDTLQQVIQSTLQCPGSSVAGFLVHGRTPGKAYRARRANEIAPPVVSGSRNRMTRDTIRYELGVAKLVEDTWSQFTALIDSTQVPPQLTARTDLLGTFEVLSSELASLPDRATKFVYYFSDMYESMVGPGRRYFDKRPPQSYVEAEEWARADLNYILREMSIDPARFSGVEVRVLTEGLANRPNADQVRRYWEVLFDELGFSTVRFN